MIRPATAADAEGIARVNVAAWPAAYAALPGAAAPSVPATAAAWERRLAEGAVRAWVAAQGQVTGGEVTGGEVGGEVTGYAAAGPSRDADRPAAGEVYAVYVHPARQRAGLGRALLAAAAAWLRDEGMAERTLWVLRDDPGARAFYEACGWRPDGAQRGIDVGGVVVDEVRYAAVS